MTEKMSQDERLFAEALDLIIRLHGDPGNPAARELAERWRARGPAYQQAWSEAIHLHGITGKLVQARQPPAMPRAGLTRRRFLAGGTAAVAAAGAGLLVTPQLLLRARASHLTATAEVQQIPLSDGSQVFLGPDSAITTDFSAGQRRVELLAGMAFFDVADDPQRPFIASNGGLEVNTRSSAFDLSQDADALTIAVERGAVEVATPGFSLSLNEAVSAGSWLTLDGNSGQVERGTRQPDQLASWRSGMLIAEGETIAAVVARIARWLPGKVVITNDALARRRISGIYNLDNPRQALAAVIQPYAGQLRSVTPWLTLISAA